MAKKAKKAAKKSGAKKTPRKVAKKSTKKSVAKRSSHQIANKKSNRAPVKRSKPKVPSSEPNKAIVSRAVDAIKEVAAPLLPSSGSDKPLNTRANFKMDRSGAA